MPELTPEQLAEITAALTAPKTRAGDGSPKIAAIKLYRGFTGEGLKEAKDAIELLMATLPPLPKPCAHNRTGWLETEGQPDGYFVSTKCLDCGKVGTTAIDFSSFEWE